MPITTWKQFYESKGKENLEVKEEKLDADLEEEEPDEPKEKVKSCGSCCKKSKKSKK